MITLFNQIKNPKIDKEDQEEIRKIRRSKKNQL